VILKIYCFQKTQAPWKNLPLPAHSTNTVHKSLQFQAEMDSKTPTSCFPFQTSYDYRCKLLINRDLFLHSSLHNMML